MQQPPDPTAAARLPAADRHERQAIARLVEAFFGALSFAPGRPPRHDALRALFLEPGQLIDNAGPAPKVMALVDFVRSRQAALAGGALTQFEIVELADTTERFGSVAHRASAFVRRGLRDGQPFERRGMIFLQCVHTPQGWKLVSAAWDDQRPGQALAGHAEPTEFG